MKSNKKKSIIQNPKTRRQIAQYLDGLLKYCEDKPRAGKGRLYKCNCLHLK